LTFGGKRVGKEKISGVRKKISGVKRSVGAGFGNSVLTWKKDLGPKLHYTLYEARKEPVASHLQNSILGWKRR